jgi:hypothetical protein
MKKLYIIPYNSIGGTTVTYLVAVYTIEERLVGGIQSREGGWHSRPSIRRREVSQHETYVAANELARWIDKYYPKAIVEFI